MSQAGDDAQLRIGWAQADITPIEPTMIAGQFHARVAEGVRDPIMASVLALERGDTHVVLVGCDLVAISDELRAAVAARLGPDGPDPAAIIMNATHTHTAPEIRPKGDEPGTTAQAVGVDLDVMGIEEYVAFAGERIAEAVTQAWEGRAAGAVSYGLGYAVVGRNRRWVGTSGRATMYGNTDTPQFSHIEGYEDHSVNVLATYDGSGALTGVVVNIACTAQETEGLFQISADFWHETRVELRRRLGEGLFVLPQASAAGDQSPHLLWDKRAATRMLALKGRDERTEIAHRLADAVQEVLGWLDGTQDAAPVLRHEARTLQVPLRTLSEEDVRAAQAEAEQWRERYQAERRRLEEHPELREQPRWYVEVTKAYRRMNWFLRVAENYERQQQEPNRPAQIHVVRLGDVAFATNPFEYYLDYGVYIKARSPAVQTFLVQLAGPGTYVPSARSIAGGGYGSVPASTPIGPEGGRLVAETSVEMIRRMWEGP
ncbi:MAG: hypothetical protein AB7Y46_07800 [Armatimonadota bacterium]